jgi:hypothetical protein
LRISLLTAATISGVNPGASADSSASPVGVVEQPFAEFADVNPATGAKAAASWLSTISRVTSSLS